MKVLIAPDKFKDALDAGSVADALAAGVLDSDPAARLVRCPLADGGEGTGALLAEAIGADKRTATVCDPLGRPRLAHWWFHAGRRLAIVEMAEASGLALLPPAERNPQRTSSFGTGQLLKSAASEGATEIWLTVGGSATVDGGAGCLQALGWQLRSAAGRPSAVPIVGGDLPKITAMVPPPAAGPKVTVLCDVENALLGRVGAAPAFAPQKGAGAEETAQLAGGLEHWANVLLQATGRDVRAVRSGGAAGGLPAGLAAALGAEIVSGFDRVADELQLERLSQGCDWCFTGEGRLDAQTWGGKVVAGVVRRLADACPVVAFVGQNAAGAARGGLAAVVEIAPPGTELSQALAETAVNLRAAVRRFLDGGR